MLTTTARMKRMIKKVIDITFEKKNVCPHNRTKTMIYFFYFFKNRKNIKLNTFLIYESILSNQYNVCKVCGKIKYKFQLKINLFPGDCE